MKTKERISFSKIKNKLDYPDFLEIQLKSFNEFFKVDSTQEERKKEGLSEVFNENFPIADTRNNFVLEFLDYQFIFSIIKSARRIYNCSAGSQQNRSEFQKLTLYLCKFTLIIFSPRSQCLIIFSKHAFSRTRRIN